MPKLYTDYNLGQKTWPVPIYAVFDVTDADASAGEFEVLLANSDVRQSSGPRDGRCLYEPV